MKKDNEKDQKIGDRHGFMLNPFQLIAGIFLWLVDVIKKKIKGEKDEDDNAGW